MSNRANKAKLTFANYIRPCLTCGATVRVVDGRAESHEHVSHIDKAALIAYAWWAGFDAAKAES